MVSKANQSEGTRRALLDAARALFTERGFAGASVEAVVQAAEVTKGALYHHFADKRALFEAVFEEVERAVVERMMSAAGDLDDPLETLYRGADTFLDVCLDPTVRRVALIEAPAVLGWERWRELEQTYGLGLAQTALEAAMEAGVIHRQAVQPLAHVLFGALIEAGLILANTADPEAARHEVGQTINRIIDALRID